MLYCPKCGGHLHTTSQDMQRIIHGQPVLVLSVPMKKCERCCEAIEWLTTLAEIDRMLSERFARGAVNIITFNELVNATWAPVVTVSE